MVVHNLVALESFEFKKFNHFLKLSASPVFQKRKLAQKFGFVHLVLVGLLL